MSLISRMKPENLNRILALIGCLTGVVALFLSREANNIARQEITAHVVVLTTDNYGAILTSFGAAPNTPVHTCYECFQDIRLTNLGGASTAVVGFDAIIRFKQNRISVSSKEAIAYANDTFESRIGDFAIVFLNEDGERHFSPRFEGYVPTYLLKFPI